MLRGDFQRFNYFFGPFNCATEYFVVDSLDGDSGLFITLYVAARQSPGN